MRPLTALTLMLLLSLLNACTITEQQGATQMTDWQTHQSQIAALQRWSVSGKAALRSANAAESASMVWQQQGNDATLQLSGPLGVGAIAIHSNGKTLDIRRGETQRLLDISSPDAIVRNTGWDIPLAALTHWMRGVPSPDFVVQELILNPQTGLLQTLRQDDWHIHYQAYDEFQGLTLPTRLQAKRGANSIKIVLRQWQNLST